MTKEIFVIEVQRDTNGDVRYSPPMVMGTEEIEVYPSLEDIENAMRKHNGNLARVLKSYKLI